jgi:hypothetical protein
MTAVPPNLGHTPGVPYTLPRALSPAISRLASSPALIQADTPPNGGKPPVPGALTDLAPLYLRSGIDNDVQLTPLRASEFGDAARQASLVAKSLVSDTVMPEDRGPALVERRAAAVALLQAEDGAYYVSGLVTRPSWARTDGFGYAASVRLATRREDDPTWHYSRSLLSMTGAAPAVKAVFVGDAWWDLRNGDALSPSTPIPNAG